VPEFQDIVSATNRGDYWTDRDFPRQILCPAMEKQNRMLQALPAKGLEGAANDKDIGVNEEDSSTRPRSQCRRRGAYAKLRKNNVPLAVLRRNAQGGAKTFRLLL
jgi:hypothetical protein